MDSLGVAVPFTFTTFFVNSSDIWHKYYYTYGHPHYGAWDQSLGNLHTDLGLMILCMMNRTVNTSIFGDWVDGGLENIEGAAPAWRVVSCKVFDGRRSHLRAAKELRYSVTVMRLMKNEMGSL